MAVILLWTRPRQVLDGQETRDSHNKSWTVASAYLVICAFTVFQSFNWNVQFDSDVGVEGRLTMKILLTAATAALMAFGCATAADAAVRAGTLTCQSAPRVGAIIGSSTQGRCVFTSARGHRHYYSARFTRFGPDIGVTGGSRTVWAVFAPTAIPHHKRALVGNFVGASADAAIGVGLGANVLVGGSSNTISLQPLSVKTQTGLAVGAGIGSLQLR